MGPGRGGHGLLSVVSPDQDSLGSAVSQAYQVCGPPSLSGGRPVPVPWARMLYYGHMVRTRQGERENPLNWLDWAMLALIGVPALLGLRAGLLRGAATLGGVLVGIVLASQLQGPAARLTGLLLKDGARAAGFLLVLLGSLVAAWLLAALVQRMLSLLLLGWLDRLAGALLGVVMGAVLVSVLVMLLELLPLAAARTAVEGSSLAAFLQRVVFPLLRRLPGEFGPVAA